MRSMATLLKRDNFVRNLHLLTGDARQMCENLIASQVVNDQGWRVMDPFDGMYIPKISVSAGPLLCQQHAVNLTAQQSTVCPIDKRQGMMRQRATITHIVDSSIPACVSNDHTHSGC